MGGSAFASLGLATPRMPPETYFALKKRHHDILRRLYAHVTTPPEAPEKTTYGDIDFLVAEPLPLHELASDELPICASTAPKPRRSLATTVDRVKVAFGAEYSISVGVTRSYAVPIDGDKKNAADKVYAQIDVHICPSAENMHWMAFKHGYGDMWSILGMMSRAKGLIADEVGLKLRVSEIEARNKEASKVELTRDVRETLAFFGLDWGIYSAGFADLESVFWFICGSRFFEDKYFKRRKFSTARDRRKIKKREMIRRWLEFLGMVIPDDDDGDDEGEEISDLKGNGGEYGDEEEEDEREQEEKVTREQVLEEALDTFGKRSVYEEKLGIWRKNEKIDIVIRRVVAALVKSGVGAKSSRTKASQLRKQLQGGEMDEVLDVAEEGMQRFVDRQVEDFRKTYRSRRRGSESGVSEGDIKEAEGVVGQLKDTHL
ncbi:hypothetical protein Dda_3728 [Drechslerella dactyloides]|uniref:Uncharacterized protein n=1 Tax=Drechslerella dactyloides TaxID=74499 RepID=A0AAD6IYG8_DREDA|nr:hypothetical protein Dda_3728 [Drechslerella dactyloides]